MSITKERVVKFLKGLTNDKTTKEELDIIKYLKKCVDSCQGTNEPTEQCKLVIDYLNEKAGTKFRYVGSNCKYISARLKDYPVETLKSVIDKQVKKWKNTEWAMYLRPETLFNQTKFETYANGLENKAKPSSFSTRQYNDNSFNNLFDNIDNVDL